MDSTHVSFSEIDDHVQLNRQTDKIKSLSEPFTIRVFVPDGDPQDVKIVERLN